MRKKICLRAMIRLFALAALSALAASSAVAQNIPPELIVYPETIVYNGKILTADDKFSVVEAVAVRDGKFLAVGKSDQMLKLAGPTTRKIDLKGKTAAAGIIDLHNSPFNSGWAAWWDRRSVPDGHRWRSREEAVEGLKKAAATAKPGEPIILARTGIWTSIDPLKGGRTGDFCELFTREQIDQLTPDNPVFFLSPVNNTTLAENSKAAEVSKQFLPEGVTTPFIKDGSICVAPGADLDGILTPGSQAANDYTFWYIPPDSLLGKDEPFQATQRKLNEAGTTLIKEHMGVPLFNGVRALWEQGNLTVRFRMPAFLVPQISGHTVELPAGMNAESFFRRWANLTGIGDPMLRITGFRIPAVGGNVPGGDAWMLDQKSRPYPDRWGNPNPYGGRIQEQAAVERGDTKNTFRARDVVIQGVRYGWDVSADHTIGDRAFREVLNAFEEGLKDQVVKRPNQRLTTNHTPMANKADIERAAKMHVWSSISTGHIMGDRDLEAGLLQFGTERVGNMAPIKSYIKAGSHPSLESTMWESASNREGAEIRSSFFWIGKSITRKDNRYRRQWNPVEALSRQEALWASTLWPAQQLAEDKQLGSIEPGKLADLVVMDKDFMTVPEDDIEQIAVVLTMVNGKVVFEREGALK